ncbi:MAG: Hint domain-containing protein [Candidatus Pacearchaeota archaeon]|jgi:hypothetical protein|nr:hypothetical protein [Clostridia bacterium]
MQDQIINTTNEHTFVPGKFTKYSEIENTYRGREIDRITEQGNAGGVWRLSEKVHGCLTYESLVDTLEFGKLAIGKIIEERLDCHAKSLNIDTNEIEWKRVINFSIKEDNNDWYEIETTNGKIIQVTGSHYIWLPELHCWRQVKDLTTNDKVLID